MLKVLKLYNYNFAALDKSISGNYTCSVRNLFGDDSITYALMVVMPPEAPTMKLQYMTTDSIRFKWNHPDNGGATIQGNQTIHNFILELCKIILNCEIFCFKIIY